MDQTGYNIQQNNRPFSLLHELKSFTNTQEKNLLINATKLTSEKQRNVIHVRCLLFFKIV